MQPAQAIDIAIGLIEAGFRVQALAAEAQAQGRDVDWDDVDRLVAESEIKRAQFEANRPK